jgi:hypothetical protein
MNALLQMKLHKASLTPSLKGVKTLPSVGLDDKGFAYTPAISTDLKATYARVRNSLGVRKVVRA